MRDVQARQSTIRALIEEDDDVAPVSFVGTARVSDGVQLLVGRIHSTLSFDLQSFRSDQNPTSAFGPTEPHILRPISSPSQRP